jgi:hypothetical protein
MNDVDRETAVARKQVEGTETAIMWEQEDMRNVKNAGLKITKPETSLEGMLNAISDSLSDSATSHDVEDGDDMDDDEASPQLPKL